MYTINKLKEIEMLINELELNELEVKVNNYKVALLSSSTLDLLKRLSFSSNVTYLLNVTQQELDLVESEFRCLDTKFFELRENYAAKLNYLCILVQKTLSFYTENFESNRVQKVNKRTGVVTYVKPLQNLLDEVNSQRDDLYHKVQNLTTPNLVNLSYLKVYGYVVLSGETVYLSSLQLKSNSFVQLVKELKEVCRQKKQKSLEYNKALEYCNL
jgi:hypothetical protein